MTSRRRSSVTTRRRFLILSARALAAAPLVACAEESSPRTGTDTGTDIGTDTGADAPVDAPADVGSDASTDTENPDSRADADVADGAAPQALPVTKLPWTMVAGATAVRLRTETATDVALDVTLVAADDTRVTLSAERATEEVLLEWPVPGLRADHPDVPGDYTLHEVLFTDLVPGEWYRYELTAPGFETVTGRFRAPCAPDAAFRMAWVADTMWPNSIQTAQLAAAQEPDLFLHGGDIQYFSNPGDTWNGYFAYFAGVFSRATAHHAIGNHEYEAFDEYESQFVRLFGGQGEPTGTEEYFAFSFGGLRFVFLNSEVDFGIAGTAQSQWLEAELAAAAASDDIRFTVVAFHRPIYTFGKSDVDMDKRGYLHPLFLAHGVKLVLQGHNHGYERFAVDGIAYIVDGGGGAALTDVNDKLEEVAALRPEEPALRLVASETYGVLVMDVDAAGRLTAVRRSTAGDIVDEFTVEA